MDFVTFDELKDTLKEESLDMEVFIQKTLEMSKTATDEEWRPQFDAVQNLRILNKYHFSTLE